MQLVAQSFAYEQKFAPTPADLQGNANTINTGNSALKYDGLWFFGQLNSPDLRKDNKQFDFDVALMPKGADPSRPHRGWSEGMALSKTDKVDAAWTFARQACAV